MNKCLLCVGNEFVLPDNNGILFGRRMQNYSYCDVIIGGLGGMSLISYFEQYEKILVADYMPDFCNAKIYHYKELIEILPKENYTHDSAFVYLLHSLPLILEKLPHIDFLACNDIKNKKLELTYLEWINE